VAHPNAKEVLCHCATDSKQPPVATPVNEHQQSEAIRSRSTGPFSLANWKCVEITMRYQDWFPSGESLREWWPCSHNIDSIVGLKIYFITRMKCKIVGKEYNRQPLLPKHCMFEVYLNIIHKSKLYIIESTLYLRSAFLWNFTQRKVVLPYRRFGTTYRSHLQESERLGLLNLRRWGR
jgi:hypothetical protein